MDHRYGSRQSLNLNVTFYKNGRYFGRYCIKNFSLDGLAIQLNRYGEDLDTGERLNINIGAQPHPKFIPCQVVRRDSGECGLMVLEKEHVFYQYMKSLYEVCEARKVVA